MRFPTILLVIIAGFAANCLAKTDVNTLKEIVGKVNPDSIMHNLQILSGEKQAIIDGELKHIESRKNNCEGNHLAARYIYQKLIDYGYQPVLNHYTDYIVFNKEDSTIKFINPAEYVTATITGSKEPDKYIVLSAHFDSAAESIAPGADDNGSGVVTVLEAARILKDYQSDYSIVFALFDHEENGPSSAFAFVDSVKNAGVTKMSCINVDMLGYENDEIWETIVYISNENIHMPMALVIDETEKQLELRTKLFISDTFFIKEDYGYKINFGVSDDVAFNYSGYPALTIIEQTKQGHFNSGYHSEKD